MIYFLLFYFFCSATPLPCMHSSPSALIIVCMQSYQHARIPVGVIMNGEDSIILEDVPVITPTGDIIVSKLSLEVSLQFHLGKKG